MPYGYHRRILHVDLTTGRLEVERPEEKFYRQYLGGSAMGAYYLLHHTPPGVDPLSAENTLSLMLSVVTGAPISGLSRVAAVARSPLSNLADESSGGGNWPAELKFAGYDGIVIHGQAKHPVYLWIHDGEAELRDASHLWGHFTADVEDTIRRELGDARVRVLQCGPAAERGVLYGALVSDLNHVNGRGGMGTVMAAKKLKAIAVRGRDRPPLAHPDALKELARWGRQRVPRSGVAGLRMLGTAGMLLPQSRQGGLPTRNWSSGSFEGAEEIGGERLAETIFKRDDTCFGCAVRCKRIVKVTEGPYRVDPRYGGPEYETLATMGSYCGVNDLAAIACANQLCNMYGLDTISCGATIAWAMDCFERGLLSTADTDGLELRFGNAAAMVAMVEQIGRREGLGRLLGEGSARAAAALGVGQELVVAVKGREIPAHMPQVKGAMAVIYAVNPGGADHTVFDHDPSYSSRRYATRMAEIGLLDPQPGNVLNEEKVRFAFYSQCLIGGLDALCGCKFVFGPSWQLYSSGQLVQAVQAITGWNFSLWELIKAGERRLNLLRAFNAREGVGREADTLPPRLFTPLRGGPTDGVALNVEQVQKALSLYYRMAGWDTDGRPTRAKLVELALGWVADELGV